MKPSDLTAVLLCGGRGSRMGSLTDEQPKCLVKVNGKPIIQHILNQLVTQEIRRVIICEGYKREKIRGYFLGADHAFSYTALGSAKVPPSNPDNVLIQFSNAGPDASMTDRIIKARELFEGPALVCYGDEWADVDIEQLALDHAGHQQTATVTVMGNRADEPGGIFQTDMGPMLNIGYTIMNPHLVFASKLGLFDLFCLIREQGELNMYLHTGKRWTVNTPDDVEIAEREMA